MREIYEKYKFYPQEILFSPISRCNLACAHCAVNPVRDSPDVHRDDINPVQTISNGVKKYRKRLSINSANKFLLECNRKGIKTVGFTGGEPFLYPDFLFSIVEKALNEDITFSRIMTNGVWFKTKKQLKSILLELYRTGYDGSLCVSVDAFHSGQSLRKAALFITTASSIWKRKDLVSLAYVWGAKQRQTQNKLKKLADILKAKLVMFSHSRACIKNKDLFLKLLRVDLSAVGRAEKLKYPWDGKWFSEDYCQGPGNVFFVMPNGDVKPCCGYANELKELTIGNIKEDSFDEIMKKAKKNRFVSTVFNSGLSSIRKRLQAKGVKFPGKTTNHCFFCYYILKTIPESILKECLD